MPNTKYFAIDPNGEIHTRSTARTYTHTVLAKRSYERALGYANREEVNDRSTYHHYLTKLDGTCTLMARRSWQTEEQHAEHVANEVARATQRLMGATSEDDYVAKVIEERVRNVNDRHAKGHYDKWVNLGWCGRRDLAEKLLGQYANRGDYSNVIIVEAQTK